MPVRRTARKTGLVFAAGAGLALRRKRTPVARANNSFRAARHVLSTSPSDRRPRACEKGDARLSFSRLAAPDTVLTPSPNPSLQERQPESDTNPNRQKPPRLPSALDRDTRDSPCVFGGASKGVLDAKALAVVLSAWPDVGAKRAAVTICGNTASFFAWAAHLPSHRFALPRLFPTASRTVFPF
ncbi:hypothetical protein B0J12DRAFT_700294 [Macrophomina phaseolina]|uniref:Uncharacterized protein n=1 Tax=Macrophomina phaseolina TaxID=35725 RepID=A0ABQ8G8V8_9PEZI|nr:hypothetical protein B0J12DRAFT_700294 [Macrophomina phaseolina]